MQIWKNRLQENGLKFNIGKTEYLECVIPIDESFKIDNTMLWKTIRFKYLGLNISPGENN